MTSPIAAVRALRPDISPAEAREVVLAVLGAVREPSGAMQAAGRDVLLEYVDMLRKPVTDQWQLARDSYRAAIDALMAEVQEEGR